MKNLLILAFFLFSLNGFGQITTKDGNLILSSHGVKQGEPTNIWEGWSQGIYETPHGVFIITTEWGEINRSFNVVTYQFINDTLKRFDLLDGYVIYDYSKDRDLFLVRDRSNLTDVLDSRTVVGFDIYTFNLKNNNFTFQIKNLVPESNKDGIKEAKFISSGNEIQYAYNNKKQGTKIKEKISVK